MHKHYTLPVYDLQLFNGTAAGEATGGEAGTSGQEGAGTLPKAENRGSSRRRSGEYDNVVFGKQEDAPVAETAADPAAGGSEGSTKSDVVTTSDALEAKRKAFRELIEGEYKDQYTETFQKVFNRRFREAKHMEDSLAAQKPIMDLLLQRYKIEGGDMDKLRSAIEEDSSYWERAAKDRGVSVEQCKEMEKLERENARLKAMEDRRTGNLHAKARMDRWSRETDEARQAYPGFDLSAEMENREFRGLLQAGIPMRSAYELIHMEEIKNAAARSAAQAVSRQMEARIRSRGARPSENGTSSQSAVVVKSDVHSLSRADRAEAIRRARRGEKIFF